MGFSIVIQKGETNSGLHRRLAALADADDLIENALRHFPFGGLGHFDHFVMTDDRNLIALGIEADALARDIIHHDGIELLGCEFLASIFENVLSFRGEANDNLRLLAQGYFLEDIGGWLEVECDRPFALYLLLGN